MSKTVYMCPFHKPAERCHEEGSLCGRWFAVFQCGNKMDCGGDCFLKVDHEGPCLCIGDDDGPGSCPA